MLFINSCPKFKVLNKPFLRPKEDDLIFCYNNNKIGLANDNKIPLVAELIKNRSDTVLYCFGSIDNHKCFLSDGEGVESRLNFIELRPSFLLLSQESSNAAALGAHIHYWRNLNRYCSRCGAAMNDILQDRARVCSCCNNIIYPRISPCVIVLVTNGEKMLLARSPHFPPRVLSTLAGFIDPGETIEQAVIREIKEEVGIEVNNLKYICSQPWPFPDSLMLGFTANYVSGSIHLDKNEIEFADWFDKNNLPVLPCKTSVARYLIEQHLKHFCSSSC